ncbi:hypothetical protein VTN00DRAFT_5903 [Thermoascus crustaceus]|uniref:uncharacterized protein n=1 Tax=Thermoascus crustaceus TaxID=5088 RepID=UPI003742832F
MANTTSATENRDAPESKNANPRRGRGCRRGRGRGRGGMDRPGDSTQQAKAQPAKTQPTQIQPAQAQDEKPQDQKPQTQRGRGRRRGRGRCGMDHPGDSTQPVQNDEKSQGQRGRFRAYRGGPSKGNRPRRGSNLNEKPPQPGDASVRGRYKVQQTTRGQPQQVVQTHRPVESKRESHPMDEWLELAVQVENEEQTARAVVDKQDFPPAMAEWLEAAQVDGTPVAAENKALEVEAKDTHLGNSTPLTSSLENIPAEIIAQHEADQLSTYRYLTAERDIDLHNLPDAELTPDDALEFTVLVRPSKPEPLTGMARLLAGSRAQEHCRLLRLPGEIRDKVYEYIFETHRVEIVRAKVKDPRRIRYRLQHRQLLPRDPVTHTVPSRGISFPLSPLALALVFTCKEIYRETLLFLYSTTQFVFTSSKTIRSFLEKTNPEAQGAIRHLELDHVMYNEPRLTAFRWCKDRSDMAWYLACHGMAYNFTSLRELHLNLAVWDWPIRLELGERWALPPLFFGRYHGKLEYADVKLSMGMFKKEKLENVARQLEKAMMTPEADQRKEDARVAKEKAGQLKAKHILTITM